MNFGICYVCDHLDLCSHPSGRGMLFHCPNFGPFSESPKGNLGELAQDYAVEKIKRSGLCGACDEFSACTYPHETDHWFCETWDSSE